MAVRLVMLSGSLPALGAAARDASKSAYLEVEALVIGVWLGVRVVLKAAVQTICFLLIFGPLVGITIWAQFHDDRLRERVARNGCPYAEDADVQRLPGAREREFRDRYCSR